jgi:hypothetical protein
MGGGCMQDASPDGFWFLTTSFATFGVTVKNGLVVREDSAPISGKFAGQPFANLIQWLKKDRGFRAERMTP